jgi:hypothetical protein
MMSIVALCLIVTVYFSIRVNRMEERVIKLETFQSEMDKRKKMDDKKS